MALFVVFFTHQAPPPEKVLKRTPNKENVTVEDIFIKKKNPTTASALAFIADNDLFAPSRGVAPGKKNKTIKPKKTQFELIGICNMGSTKGAMIINTSSRKGTNKKQFYSVGQPIDGTGYRLIDIDPTEETAIIGVGNTQYSIKLEREDAGSLNRRNKGESESKAMISLSKPKSPPTTTVQKTSARPSIKSAPVTPPRKGRKTPADMKRIRNEILKKMQSRTKK